MTKRFESIEYLRWKTRRALVASPVLALFFPLSAATGGTMVTLGNVAELVRDGNPSLRAARLRIAEAGGRLTQAGRLANPRVEAAFDHNPDFDEWALGVEFTQEFPVTARLRWEREVGKQEIRVAEAEVADVERRLVDRARRGVIKYLVAQARIGLAREHLNAAEALAQFIEASAAEGEGSLLDAGEARIKVTQVALEIRRRGALAEAGLATVAALIGLGPEARLSVAGSLPAPALPRASTVDPNQRPDFRAATLATAAAASETALEEAKRFEDIEVGLFALREREEDVPEGFESEARIGFKVKLPLPFWNDNRGAVAEKRAKHLRLEEESRALAMEIRQEVAVARRLMAAQAKLVQEISEELLPLASEQLKKQDAAYRQGLADLAGVLRARDQQMELAEARIEALREFHLARARFEAAAGR
jgi:outer membrane protein TolC